MTILTATVPGARITLGTDPQQLVVWARPADHEVVGELVDSITAAAAAEDAGRSATVYSLKSLTATAANSPCTWASLSPSMLSLPSRSKSAINPLTASGSSSISR